MTAERNQRGPYQEIQDLVNHLNGTREPSDKSYMWWHGRSWYLELHGKMTKVQLLKVMDPPIIFDYMYKLENGDPSTPIEPFELRYDAFWILVALFEKEEHFQRKEHVEQYLTKVGYQ